jgi:anion-transporting  ArsA/GET3 family ATPase
MVLQQRLEHRELIVVTGKGGVGKSVISASLGRLQAARGRKVLLVESDPRENLHQLVDVSPSGGEIVEVAPRLALLHIDPRSILDDLVREKLKLGLLARRVLQSPVHHHFADGAPGLKEAAVFGRILRLLGGHGPRGSPRPDVVILDAPATGHGVSWMAAPQLVSDVVQSGPVGSMAKEIARFIEDRQRCGVVLVTSAEEMPVQEALELIDSLEQRLSRRPDLVVVNAVYPPAPEGEDRQPADHLDRLWRRRRQVNERELARLEAAWDGPLAELPLLPMAPGPALVGAIGTRLEAGLREIG